MKIRKLVVNEPRRTLAICSLKACNTCHLCSGFYGQTVYQQIIELWAYKARKWQSIPRLNIYLLEKCFLMSKFD